MQTNNKRGVTFDAMETFERNSDCIDKLTLLVSDMKILIDRKQAPYKPRIYQGRSRIQSRNQQFDVDFSFCWFFRPHISICISVSFQT